MNILAIDPGTTHSAWCILKSGDVVSAFGKEDNKWLLEGLRRTLYGWHTVDHVVIEMMSSYGKPVGNEVFETLVWIGRFMEATTRSYIPCHRITRRETKNYICKGRRKRNDATVRACLLERYGAGGVNAIGTKKLPGPLYGVTGDVWSAIAVGIAWKEIRGISLPKPGRVFDDPIDKTPAPQ